LYHCRERVALVHDQRFGGTSERKKTHRDVNPGLFISVISKERLSGGKKISFTIEMRMHHEWFGESKISYGTLD
jgi:hypothetical protein